MIPQTGQLKLINQYALAFSLCISFSCNVYMFNIIIDLNEKFKNDSIAREKYKDEQIKIFQDQIIRSNEIEKASRILKDQ